MSSWNVGWFIGTLFVIVNLTCQLIPCGMILARKKTDIACGILFFTIALQVSLTCGTVTQDSLMFVESKHVARVSVEPDGLKFSSAGCEPYT
jgi:MFS-type transporter involved in bile tolerance (Atg22 family)